MNDVSAQCALALGLSSQQCTSVITSYAYTLFWIALSTVVIIYNKWILTIYGFDFPITLTMWHMGVCSVASFLLVRLKLVETVNMPTKLYMRTAVPIALLFSGTLWMGNAAYLTLSVSFIQMIKALMPAATYTCSVMYGIEKRTSENVCIMLVITFGVALASYGELNFVLIGVLFQLGAIFTESNRIVLLQMLLQSNGIKFNPVQSMYYISPLCFCFLSIPWAFLERSRLHDTSFLRTMTNDDYGMFAGNALAAFGLNVSVFLLVGQTSALTMNIAGVVKDWLLIWISYSFFKAPISLLNIIGYGIAFVAVCYFNYVKFKSMNQETSKKEDTKHDVEMEALPFPSPQEDPPALESK
jgi:hypothetical protein